MIDVAEKVWDQQKGEPDNAFMAFHTYRTALPRLRTYTHVSKKLGCTPGLISQWAKTYDWENRLASWNEYRNKILAQREIAKQAKAVKEHKKAGDKLLRKADALLTKHLQMGDYGPQHMLQMFKLGKEMRDSALGLDQPLNQ